jgi:hypothetical protein
VVHRSFISAALLKSEVCRGAKIRAQVRAKESGIKVPLYQISSYAKSATTGAGTFDSPIWDIMV